MTFFPTASLVPAYSHNIVQQLGDCGGIVIRPLKCVKDVTGQDPVAALNPLTQFEQQLASGLLKILQAVATFWEKVPSPAPYDSAQHAWSIGAVYGAARQAGQNPSGIDLGQIYAALAPAATVVAMVGVLIACGRVALSSELRQGLNVVPMLVRIIVINGCGLLALNYLLIYSDSFSNYIVETASGTTMTQGMAELISDNMISGIGGAIFVIAGFILVLASLMQVIWMILRGGLIVVLAAVWPLAAASSGTEEGLSWWKKINGLLLALIVYKPVASIIYAVGFRLLHGDNFGGDQVMAFAMGSGIILMASFALPAVIKFIAPIAAGAAPSGFSGGAALGAVAATGAIAVTGGAGMAAGAAGRASGAVAATSPGSSSMAGPSPAAQGPGGKSSGPGASGPSQPSGGGNPSPSAGGSGGSAQGSGQQSGDSAGGSSTEGAAGSQSGSGGSSGEGSSGSAPAASASGGSSAAAGTLPESSESSGSSGSSGLSGSSGAGRASGTQPGSGGPVTDGAGAATSGGGSDSNPRSSSAAGSAGSSTSSTGADSGVDGATRPAGTPADGGGAQPSGATSGRGGTGGGGASAGRAGDVLDGVARGAAHVRGSMDELGEE